MTGLDDSKQYNIALFAADNVKSNGGQISFADAEKNTDGATGDDVADQGTVHATITSVNNGSVSNPATPVNGVIKFTVNSDQVDDVIPVLWLNKTGGDAGLDLNADNTPSESFGATPLITPFPLVRSETYCKRHPTPHHGQRGSPDVLATASARGHGWLLGAWLRPTRQT